MYPLKKGKGKISDTQKKKLYKLGDELNDVSPVTLPLLIRNVSADSTWHTKWPQHFFNSGYIDYLDEVYEKNHPPPANP